MKNRGTTALIALFFAGLVGLWVADAWQVPNAAERERWKGRVLPSMVSVRPDDLRRVEIDGAGGPIVFERRPGRRWQMTAPLDVAADPSMVENLAFRLKELARRPQADTLKVDDPAEFGLAPAARTIRLWGKATDAPLATLELGKVSLDRRYVRAGGGAGVEVVAAQGLEVADLPPARWRDREVFRAPTFEVSTVQVHAQAREPRDKDLDLRLRRDRDAWRIVEPIRALAEESKIEGLVANLGSLRLTSDKQYVADGVKEADLARYGLDKPAATVTISRGRGGEDRPDQTLQVGKAVEGQPERVYAKLADQDDVLALDARVLDALRGIKPNDFRSIRVADLDPNRATRFRVASGGKSFEVARSGNLWYLTKPTAGRADPKAVQEFFQALEGLKTNLYLGGDEATRKFTGLAESADGIQVWQAPDPRAVAGGEDAAKDETKSVDDAPAFAIRFGNRDAGKKILYAQTEGDSSILAIQEVGTDRLFKESWAFRDRLVLAAATEQVERIRFEGPGRHVVLQAPILKLELLKNRPVGWWMTEPVTAPADDESVGKLLKLLAAFRVDGYAADGPTDLKRFGLDAPALRVTWSTPAAAPPSPVPLPAPPAVGAAAKALPLDEMTLLVGAPVAERPSMRYAMLAGRPLVFMLGGETLATLDAEWHTHQALRFDPEQVRKVHVRWPGSPWAFDLVRSGSAWTPAAPVDAPGFDPAATDSIIQAASNLTTLRYSQYAGEMPAGAGLTPPRLELRFTVEGLARPVELDLGNPADPTRSYAATPAAQPGAIFLAPNASLLPWLQVQPPAADELPADVFHRDEPESVPRAPADRPGQGAGQPR